VQRFERVHQIVRGGLAFDGRVHREDDFGHAFARAFDELAEIVTINARKLNTPLTPGSKIEYEMPDMYGRPWAKVWEEHFEQGMTKPEVSEDLFNFEN